MTSFRKPVSTIEKLYLVFNRLRPPFANQFLIEGSGRIDPVALEAAVARSSQVNPGACLRMTGRLGRRAWIPGPMPRVTVVPGAQWDGRSEVGAPFLDRHLDPERGPTCEVQIIESGPRTFLVFRSLHAVMDGLGTLFWAQDVLRALRGETPVGYPSAMTDSEFVAGVTDETMVLPPRDALHPCGRADAVTSGNDFQWRRVVIDEPRDVPIVAALVAVVAAEARRHGPGVVRCNIPADLRGFQKDQRSTGNAVGTLLLEVPAGATVDGIAQDVKARLRAREHARFPAHYEALRWLPLGVLEAMIQRGFATEHESGRYTMTTNLSFMGSIDPASVVVPGFTTTTAFWIPPMADQGCFIAAMRFRSHLHLLLAMPRVLASRGRFDALLGRLTEVLDGRATPATRTA